MMVKFDGKPLCLEQEIVLCYLIKLCGFNLKYECMEKEDLLMLLMWYKGLLTQIWDEDLKGMMLDYFRAREQQCSDMFPENSHNAPIVCYRCKKAGHIARGCKAFQCFGCGEEGHVRFACRKQRHASGCIPPSCQAFQNRQLPPADMVELSSPVAHVPKPVPRPRLSLHTSVSTAASQRAASDSVMSVSVVSPGTCDMSASVMSTSVTSAGIMSSCDNSVSVSSASVPSEISRSDTGMLVGIDITSIGMYSESTVDIVYQSDDSCDSCGDVEDDCESDSLNPWLESSQMCDSENDMEFSDLVDGENCEEPISSDENNSDNSCGDVKSEHDMPMWAQKVSECIGFRCGVMPVSDFIDYVELNKGIVPESLVLEVIAAAKGISGCKYDNDYELRLRDLYVQ